MKFIVSTIAALACLAPAAALAQTAPAPAPTASATTTAKFNLDTPIETLAADAGAKAVLEANVPGMTTHAHYDMFKAMSLRAVQPMSGGKLTEETLKKIEIELAAIK
jgi:hypothetical protein